MNDSPQPSSSDPDSHKTSLGQAGAIEPWDSPAYPAKTPNVWYGFVAFTIGMMVLGGLLVFMGAVCQFNPEGVLQIQNESGMVPAFHNVAEVASVAKVYYSLGCFYVLGGAIAFIIPHSIGRWAYGIIYIILAGLTCLYAPFAIVMIIFWLLPSTRSYFETPKQPLD